MFVLQIKPEDCFLLGKEILNYLLKSFWKYAAHLPENQRPSDYELYDKTFKIIKSFN